jgi:predicted nuclease of predicted toxin-antitoxin system
MRILLDESLPRRLVGKLAGHTASTVTDNGWSGLENGELLRIAVPDFDVFLTADQNLEYQQNLRRLPLAVVVLIARDNTLDTLRPLLPELLDLLERLEPCTLVKIGSRGAHRRSTG